jgi:rubredoxin
MDYACEICGYVHDGDDLPDMCPVCGAPKSKFTEWTEEDPDFLTDETVEGDRDSFEDNLYGDYEE